MKAYYMLFSIVSPWMKLLTCIFHVLLFCLYKMQYIEHVELHAKKKMIKEIGNVKGVMKEPKKKLLVTVNVLGSVGPIRFLANEDDNISSVINTTLKAYDRQGRIPVLGFDVNNFSFYSINAGFNSISHTTPYTTLYFCSFRII